MTVKGEFELPAEHEDDDGVGQSDGGAAGQGRRRNLRVYRQQSHRHRRHLHSPHRRTYDRPSTVSTITNSGQSDLVMGRVATAAWYWLRPVVDDRWRQDWTTGTSPSCKQCHCHGPLIVPFPAGDSGPTLIHGSLSPLESTFQTGSASVQPFLHSSSVCRAHRHTDRLLRSNTPHLRTLA